MKQSSWSAEQSENKSPSSCCCWPRVSGRGSSMVVLWRADSSGVVIVSIPHCSTAALQHRIHFTAAGIHSTSLCSYSGRRVFNLSWGGANLYLVCCISVQTWYTNTADGDDPWSHFLHLKCMMGRLKTLCQENINHDWMSANSPRECCEKCHRSLQSAYELSPRESTFRVSSCHFLGWLLKSLLSLFLVQMG